MHPLLRFLLRLAKWGLDALAAIIIAGYAALLSLSKRKQTQGGVNAIFIIPGGDVESIYRKFGTLNVYFSDNPDFFGKVTRLLLGRGNFSLQLKDDFVVIERNTDNTRFPMVGYARLLLEAIRLAKREPVNIIHARSPYQPGLIGLAASRLLGIPLCISIHSDYEKREELQKGTIPRLMGSLWLSRKVETICYKFARRILPIRESMVPHILAVGGAQEKIRLWPHGVNLNAFTLPNQIDIRNHFNLPQEAHIISSVGRLVDENYADDLLEISKKLVNSRPDTYCLLCGSGDRELDLRDAVKQAGLESRIIVPGNISLQVSYELRKQSRVNLSLMGGFSLIEACAGGNPTIAYDVEWHYELVKTGETGLLAQEHDTDAVVETTLQYLDDPTLAARHGEAGKKLAFERHSSSTVKKYRAATYREILDEVE